MFSACPYYECYCMCMALLATLYNNNKPIICTMHGCWSRLQMWHSWINFSLMRSSSLPRANSSNIECTSLAAHSVFSYSTSKTLPYAPRPISTPVGFIVLYEISRGTCSFRSSLQTLYQTDYTARIAKLLWCHSLSHVTLFYPLVRMIASISVSMILS